MLKISEMKSVIPTAMEEFISAMQLDDALEDVIRNTPITICNRSNCRQKYDEACERCKRVNYGYHPGAVAEVLFGLCGSEILIYQFAVRSITALKEYLWHEWGHVIANEQSWEVAQEVLEYHWRQRTIGHELYDLEMPVANRTYYECLLYGSNLWNEFIADYIKNAVANEEITPYLGRKLMEMEFTLTHAFDDVGIDAGAIGRYCAYLLSDPTVCAERIEDPSFGIQLKPPFHTCQESLEQIMQLLQNQMDGEYPYWIDRDAVLQLGERVLVMWIEKTKAVNQDIL